MTTSNGPPDPKERPPLFPLGRVVATPAALDAMQEAGVDPRRDLLARHVRGDWGDLDPSDRRQNERSLAEGDRLLSAYTLCDGKRVWVITEAGRSATTLLLPTEY